MENLIAVSDKFVDIRFHWSEDESEWAVTVTDHEENTFAGIGPDIVTAIDRALKRYWETSDDGIRTGSVQLGQPYTGTDTESA